MVLPVGAIEPGSTEYGDRQTLEQGLSAVGGGAPMGGGGAPSPTTSLPAFDDPLSDIMNGSLPPPDSPLTSGLSAGPGAGPPNAPVGPLDNDKGQKLKMLAQQSSSPTLRRLAMARLRAMHRGDIE